MNWCGRVSYLEVLADWSKYLCRKVCATIHVLNSHSHVRITYTSPKNVVLNLLFKAFESTGFMRKWQPLQKGFKRSHLKCWTCFLQFSKALPSPSEQDDVFYGRQAELQIASSPQNCSRKRRRVVFSGTRLTLSGNIKIKATVLGLLLWFCKGGSLQSHPSL